MGKSKFSDEQIQDAVKDSFSLAEVIRKIGASITSGASRIHIRNRINNIGLDISHFKTPTIISAEKTKMLPEQILVYNRRNGVRERPYKLRQALKKIGVEEICECGQNTIWYGIKLQLEIDHIDDDPLNNVYENLRFICPNCHSQKHVDNKRSN